MLRIVFLSLVIVAAFVSVTDFADAKGSAPQSLNRK
ncbi:MAG: hypothetical protein FADNKDHG_01602 [Holosporales bacterium]